MKSESICAWLESQGYRREQIKKLSRRYVQLVLLHPRDDKGDLIMEQPGGEPSDRWSDLRFLYFLRGWPQHKIEERIGQIKEQERQERLAEEEMIRRNNELGRARLEQMRAANSGAVLSSIVDPEI